MSRIIIVNQQYFPETAATGQVFRMIAEDLASRGHSVAVVCGRPFYPGVARQVSPVETIGGVTVRRLWNTVFPKESIPGKALNQLTFMVSLLWFALFSIQNDDNVLATTAPPLGVAGLALKRKITPFNLVMSVQDLYPDVLAAAGQASTKSWMFRVLRGIMMRCLQNCRTVAAVSTDMASHLRLFYKVADVRVIPNPSVHNVRPLPFGREKAARGWADKFVVQYSGNFGRAHEYKTLLVAMRLLSGRGDILFHIAGGGSHFDALRVECGDMSNAVFEGFAPAEELSARLSIADISLVIFDGAFRDVLLPSKYAGILASGRPVLLISGAVSDISRDIERWGIGLQFGHGDGAAIADALAELAADPARVQRMGSNSRQLYLSAYRNKDIFDAYADILKL